LTDHLPGILAEDREQALVPAVKPDAGVGDATERAYRRGDALEKRRELMEAWSAFCEPSEDNVIVPMARPAHTDG
jgi:hypothetical protein